MKRLMKCVCSADELVDHLLPLIKFLLEVVLNIILSKVLNEWTVIWQVRQSKMQSLGQKVLLLLLHRYALILSAVLLQIILVLP